MEEEFNFYFRVLATSTRAEYVKRVQSAKIGAMRHFNEGRKDVFVDALKLFKEWEEWDALFDLADKALSVKDENGAPSLLGSDSRVWKAFIAAAARQDDDER